MTTTLVRRAGIDLAPAVKRDGNLLDVAKIIDGVSWLETAGLGESYNCFATDNFASFPCPQSFASAPVDTAPSTSTSGGTLAAGTYRAKITAITPAGETTVSGERSQVTTGSTSTITWNWNAVTGATGYRIYVTAVGGASGSETYLVTVGAVTTYVWTGTPARDTSILPPTVNTAIIEATKTAASPSWVDGLRFAVYALAQCKGPNALDEAALAHVFEMNESQGVEKAIMNTRMIVNGTIWAAATDLTPAGGAVDPDVGLAILEGHAGSNYAGVPTIHAPRTIGSLLASRGPGIVKQGSAYYTQQGSKLASGGGYENPNNGPAGTAPSAGELWMFGSGEVTVARGEIITQYSFNQINNDQLYLVERLYVASTDCYTAAVRVKVQ